MQVENPIPTEAPPPKKIKRKIPDPFVLAQRGWKLQGPYSTGLSSRGPEYQFFYMEGKRKDGKRRRLSFRYDPRLFTRLESFCTGAGGEPVEQMGFRGNQQIIDVPPSFVLLGYTQEAPPKPVLIREWHVIVCGIPQHSGKTTCIEGLLSRWPGNNNKMKKIIAFISKQGALFFGFRKIDPYINTNPDPDFLSPVAESILVKRKKPQVSRKINLIMAELCHNAKSLNQVSKNASRMLKKVKERDRLKHNVCIIVKYCLGEIFSQYPKFTQHIEFGDNNNVVFDLSQFSDRVKTLVIGSVAYEILKHHQDTILVVPDAWTMFDEDDLSGRFHLESLIANGSKNRNCVIIESVDIECIPLHVRRQTSTILLGYQLWGEEARVEIRALRDLASHMRRSKTMTVVEKPFLTRFSIQKLKAGEFYAFPSYIEENGVWRANKVLATPPQNKR